MGLRAKSEAHETRLAIRPASQDDNHVERPPGGNGDFRKYLMLQAETAGVTLLTLSSTILEFSLPGLRRRNSVHKKAEIKSAAACLQPKFTKVFERVAPLVALEKRQQCFNHC